MKKEIKEEVVTLDSFHAKELKYIELSLQDLESTEKAIKFNKQHNYEYKFLAKNLINTESLIPLIREGYKITRADTFLFRDDVIILYHE